MRVLICFAALGLVGCLATHSDTPEALFARNETCPVDRVSVADIGTPSVRELTLADSPPPKDIADDSERKEMWIADHSKSWSRRHDSGLREYSVEGCDVGADIACSETLGGTRCTTVARHDHKIDRMVKEADETVEKMRREMCALPMWQDTTGDCAKLRSGR